MGYFEDYSWCEPEAESQADQIVSSAIEQLKNLVFDLKKFSTEREHIQIAIEENYWLFGEQFHLVSADDTFEKALSNYLYILDGNEDSQQIDSAERNRRPDIFNV